MFKLSYKLLVSRKKWFLIITLSLSLIIAAITSIFTASESIKMGLKEEAYKNYGEHTVVVVDSNESKEDFYQKKVEKVGSIQLIGTIDLVNNGTATVGVMDRDAIELGKISLIEGTFPKAENEVAIESSYLPYIDDHWKIGEKKTLLINNVKKELILTGIIKDYSAKWSVPINVQKGVNDFPNVILSERNDGMNIESQNFLVKLNGNIRNIEKISSDFLNDYKGFFNSRLYQNGLSNFQDISFLSNIFQIVTLLTSFLTMYSLLYFFYIDQQKKFAILKTLGSTNLNLLKINLYQVLNMLLFSFLLAIPLQIGLHTLIIKNTFNVSALELSNTLYIFAILVAWIMAITGITFLSAIMAMKKIQQNSINTLLKDNRKFNRDIKNIPIRADDFVIKKVIKQAISNPKQTIITVLSLTVSILTLTLSIYVEKESIGIWDTKIDYYVNSQEVYAYQIVDNLTVLQKEGLTFSPDDLERFDKNPSIEFVEKDPFMKDVHPLLTKDQVTPDIENWFITNNSTNIKYNGKYIIPNVKYVLINKSIFNKLYPAKNYDEFLGKVILYNPAAINSSNQSNLKGEEITFIQKKKNINKYDTHEWKFEIFEVINSSFSMPISDSIKIEYPEFTVLIAEDTAVSEGIFRGYNQLSFYLKDNIGNTEREKIESDLVKLIALTPGSLYQNISNFIEEDSRISVFVGYLGKLTYVVSILLSIISLTVIVFSKFKLQKKEWGIYFTLGMRKKDVYYLLYLENFLYLLTATVLSFSIFALTNLLDNLYSFFYYLTYFCFSVLIILLLLTLGWYVTIKMIDRQSINSLIRIDE